MSIRLQLLIVALTMLILPWAGCQYARELESALRSSQEKSLLASAGTIANALSAQPQRVFRATDDTASFAMSSGDHYVFPLSSQPLLDGFRGDWSVSAEPLPLPSTNGYRSLVQVGSTERYLYVYTEVDDAHFDPEPNDLHIERDRFDRVDLTLQAPDGTLNAYFFATNAPGLIAAQTLVEGGGARNVVPEPRIQGFWLQTATGHHLEVRIPLSFVGTHLWVQTSDGGTKGKAGIAPEDNPRAGRLFFPTDGLNGLLATFLRDGTRATVIDVNGLKLGDAGNVASAAEGAADEAGSSWYRYFVGVDTSNMPVIAGSADRLTGDSVSAALFGNPNAQWVLDAGNLELLLIAAAPIAVDGHTRGAVVLQQAADQLLTSRDHALTRLFDVTLIATACAVFIMLIVATWISLRLGRLRAAADSAVSNDGTIRLSMPGSGGRDEIGDLARGFERLLARLNEHTQYLRTLGGKLSHELRTPLTIVRSSLDNLESEGLREEQMRYITRAREGTVRLQSILSALGAAARVEESIKSTERINFSLRDLLSSAVAGYRDGFPSAHLKLEVLEDPCFLRGAPELIAQLLDKLVENAVDFCPAAGTVTVRLERAQGSYLMTVLNDGPLIPDFMLGHLFESLFEQRQGHDDRPHFGLGLYIVRLIAEFHGGTAVAANRMDGGGAEFSVKFPLI